jgi:hypothetical protein
MAEAQQAPTFKLVLVGDGGTGKVCIQLFGFDCFFLSNADLRV